MNDQPIDLVSITIPAKPDYVGIARLTVSGIGTRMGFSYDDIEDIKLAVSEACTNVVDHAYMDGMGEIDLSYSIYPNRLVIDVVDRGNSFNVEEVMARTGPISVEPTMNTVRERGLGIYLMQTLMDQVDIKGDMIDGVMVTMIKYIQKDEVESHVESSKPYSASQ
ncbi:serine/threonine-protein kinase RsbW [Seinonella peptonophila]|uniref:Serine/threonine-protein kinase RsbW n=1 Tax=Seinonella peptonophila TaxID=112248 RepID=A0A1M4YC39_9BACL|nr:anti-sigma B factor RsbW [Seinonella peptonophila]SHF03300.1 serine/threonine-protein kinase RsbW [Seinonella peptonophila]